MKYPPPPPPPPAPPPPEVVARARVRIAVELEAGEAWGDDATVAQVFDQAGKAAVAALRKALPVTATVLGEPEVIAVFSERKRP